MKFIFDYREELSRRITIEADNLADAIKEIERRINDAVIVLNNLEDFAGGEITMPIKENFLPQLKRYGEDVEPEEGLDLMVDFW